ncbi:MAG: 3-deoxy-manno-octulosonate cytidylyltransferase [Deltaproteobacteria bacterium]|nr:MAG: 3-deoxy-manno-octulosonate cytidylyltransferase [Deltaproteobacteria bacterium]
MKIVAIIPARYGSKRFPGKPLAQIAGKPMIQRVYEQASKSSNLDDVYVATDDERIKACVEAFGGKAVMTSLEHPSGTDRVYEAATRIGLAPDDIVINIQGDQPLFPPGLVESLVEPLQADPGISMTTLYYPVYGAEEALNANHVKVVMDNKGFALYFSRAPIPYHREGGASPRYKKHLGVYAYRMEFLARFTRLPVGLLEKTEKLEQLRALENGFRIKMIESPVDSVEVDIEADIGRVEGLLSTGVSDN